MAVSCPTRSITSTFVKLRAAHKNKKNRFGYSLLGGDSPSDGSNGVSGRQRLLGQDHAVQIEMTGTGGSVLPPVWVDVVEEAQEDLSKAKEKMAALQKAQRNRTLTVFTDDSRGGGENREIENLSFQITESLKRCEARIHQIQPPPGSTLCDAELKLRHNAQRSIATQLQAVSQEFRKQQKQYIQDLQRRRTGPAVFEDSGDTTTAGDSRVDSLLASELDTMERDIDVRNEEIAKIAKSAAELHTMFKDLSILVIDQGTIIDRIDYNVEQVVAQTEQANVHIRKAEQHQRSARAGKVVLFLLAMIFILLSILIIKHVR